MIGLGSDKNETNICLLKIAHFSYLKPNLYLALCEAESVSNFNPSSSRQVPGRQLAQKQIIINENAVKVNQV